MRRAAKVDANQLAIILALREHGASVQPLHTVGSGCPDLLVAHAGQNFLLECKDGEKPTSARRLTLDQQHWHAQWRAAVYIVLSPREAVRVVTGREIA